MFSIYYIIFLLRILLNLEGTEIWLSTMLCGQKSGKTLAKKAVAGKSKVGGKAKVKNLVISRAFSTLIF